MTRKNGLKDLRALFCVELISPDRVILGMDWICVLLVVTLWETRFPRHFPRTKARILTRKLFWEDLMQLWQAAAVGNRSSQPTLYLMPSEAYILAYGESQIREGDRACVRADHCFSCSKKKRLTHEFLELHLTKTDRKRTFAAFDALFR